MKTVTLSREVNQTLHYTAKQQDVDVPVVLTAVLHALLHRYSQKEAICIGSLPYSSLAPIQELKTAIASHLQVSQPPVYEDLSFSELLQQVQEQISGDDRSNTPIAKAFQEANAPLTVQALLLYNAPTANTYHTESLVALSTLTNHFPLLELLLFIEESETGLAVSLTVNNQPHYLPAAHCMLEHYQEMLQAVLAAPKQRVGDINLLTAAEQSRLLFEGNRAIVSFPENDTIVTQFRIHAAQKPNAVAVVYEDAQLTYTALDFHSQQLALRLRQKGITNGALVPLYINRGIDMMIGLLGILKAGAAYVPIDPENPIERTIELLEDIAPSVIVTGNKQEQSLSSLLKKRNSSIALLNIEKAQKLIEEQDLIDTAPAPTDPAYVIYTSGSTGKPKGVLVQHNNLTDYLYGLEQQIQITTCQSFALVSTLAADLGNTVLFGSLFTGGILHILSKERASDPLTILAYFQTHQIDCLKIVPSHWQALCVGDQLLLPSKKIIFGGEALSTDIVNRIKAASPSCEIINHYGPTETTIGKLLHVVNPDAVYHPFIPLGKPFSNTQVYVLSAQLQPCATGVPGELYIGGAGVARGYYNREALTAERFINNPFEEGGRLYKTGDLVRWLSNGNIEFIGRIDDQVKISGYRIELGEIQSVLMQHPAVHQCAVLAKELPSGDKQLVAYIVPHNELDLAAVAAFLKARLPLYMVPATIIPLEALPLTNNGKLDRKALPVSLRNRPELATLYAAPTNDTEKQIAAVWKTLLQLDKIGINDNFFELGGSSLLAIKSVAQLKAQYNYEVPITTVYERPTVKGLALYLDQQEAGESQLIATQPSAADHDVAVIGMGLRFPGANTFSEFWEVLTEGRETIRFFKDEELDPHVPLGVRSDANYVKARGIVDKADEFDPAFFGINPKMAELMDPQQRIFLEIAWEALEGAGYIPENYKGAIGVFAGCRFNSYYLNNVITQTELVEKAGFLQAMTFNDKDYISSRTAYSLNLKGPAVTVQSACSTSLLAIAQAVESIRKGQCDMALAGGAIITVPINSGHIYQEGAMLSNDGHCRPFDAGAKGTIFSDGAGVVLLKSRKQAEADGDFIYGIIKGVGVNNDGGHKGSFTAPSAKGQAGAIKMAIRDAGITPASISYIEAHGTATPLGDPIEIEGLKKAFGTQEQKQFCAIGSVKSNMGHLVTAAGVAGFIKTILSLHYKQLPASLFYNQANPNIDFLNSPFYVNDKLRAWDTPHTRRAGISSFGVGGTNVHVVVEEYENALPASSSGRSKELLLLSAKTEKSREAYAQKLAGYLKKNPDISLADLAYSLQQSRQAFAARRFVVAGSVAELLEKLESTSLPAAENKLLKEAPGPIAFLFPGQGSQHLNMGRELYEQEPIYKQSIDECAALLLPELGKDIRAIIYPDAITPDAEAQLKDTQYAQPALFITAYALARLWKSWGIQPTVFAGHSIGEFVAAHLSGVFSLADALKLIAARGRLMSSLLKGTMLSVRAAATAIEPMLPLEISIAAINSPSLCVVAGPDEAITALAAQLEEKGIVSKPLQTSHAFHSPMMEPVIGPFEAIIRSIPLSAPTLPIISTVTGKLLTAEEATSSTYWANHLRVTVRFADALQTLCHLYNPILLETGAGNVLTTLARQQATKTTAIASLPAANSQTDTETILRALGQLWLSGAAIDWNAYYKDQKRRKLSLPTYAFDRKRYWVEPRIATPVTPPSVANEINNSPYQIPQHMPPETKRSRKESLVQKVKTILEDASGIEMNGVTPDMTFIEMGLDSLLLTQVALTLKKEFNLPITFRQLNEDYDNLDTLASFMEANLPAEAEPQPQPQPAVASQATAAPTQPTYAAPPVTVPTQPHYQPQPQYAPTAPVYMTTGNDTPLGLLAQQLQLLAKQVAFMQGAPVAAPAPAPTPALQPVSEAPAPPTPAPKAPTSDLTPEEEVEIKKPFGATARIDKKVTEVTEKQRRFLSDLTTRYTTKTQSSKAYTQKHRAQMADPRVVSGFKPLTKEVVYPIVIKRSKGARLWDLDGNEYIDVLNGFGSNMLGYQTDAIVKALQDQIENGYEIGPQHELAGEVCQLICEHTGFERSALCSTGSEAVLGAMRIARTVTGRSKIVAFSGSYHGIVDEVIVRGSSKLKSFPAAPGILPQAVQNMLILEYGTEESLKIIKERAHEIAAVLVEPVQSRRPEFQPFQFLRELRKVTEAGQVALIFDEIITGFRMHPQGIQGLTGIRADMATYGKVIGGGLPIGAIAGCKKYVDALDGGYWQFGDASVPEVGVTYFAGTFVRHPLALATAKASLNYMKSKGPALQEGLNQKTTWLVNELNSICEAKDLPMHIVHFGSLWKIKFKEEVPYSELLFTLMRLKGIHIMDLFPCYMTEALTEQDLHRVVSCFNESVTELIEVGIFKGAPVAIETHDIKLFKTPPAPGAKLGKDQDGNPAWFVQDPERPGKYLQVELYE
jgi:amino acid adenylation domain-containing protein